MAIVNSAAVNMKVQIPLQDSDFNSSGYLLLSGITGSYGDCIFLNFYLFMIVTQRERETGRDTGRGRNRLHAPGAWRGIRSWVSRIAPWAKGRC